MEDEADKGHMTDRQFWEATFLSVLPACDEGKIVPRDVTTVAADIATRAVHQRRQAFRRMIEQEITREHGE